MATACSLCSARGSAFPQLVRGSAMKLMQLWSLVLFHESLRMQFDVNVVLCLCWYWKLDWELRFHFEQMVTYDNTWEWLGGSYSFESHTLSLVYMCAFGYGFVSCTFCRTKYTPTCLTSHSCCKAWWASSDEMSTSLKTYKNLAKIKSIQKRMRSK